VNISPSHLYRNDFIIKIRHLIASKKINPENLVLELNENTLIRDIEGCIQKIIFLKEMGITILIDDFGKEYSCLNYLSRLPVDGIKIDKSFIAAINQNENTNAIIISIIKLAYALGLTIIAEGVETEEQLTFLTNHSCHLFQGYLYSTPKEYKELDYVQLHSNPVKF
jgi:EAL domain-containing protein (putative c-di-GMP-specific phosphodiesterase class I)